MAELSKLADLPVAIGLRLSINEFDTSPRLILLPPFLAVL
jgi:hypothetical protein